MNLCHCDHAFLRGWQSVSSREMIFNLFSSILKIISYAKKRNRNDMNLKSKEGIKP